MTGQAGAGTTVECWNALVQAQRDYVLSLASLDALVLDGASAHPAPLDQDLFEKAAKARQVAYARYRRAMDELTDCLRK
jgi:hypothetical protein